MVMEKQNERDDRWTYGGDDDETEEGLNRTRALLDRLCIYI